MCSSDLHTILRVLYDDMMALCYPMSQVAMAIAGIGALLYIAFRVWQSLAQAEPIDLFPLMRPFAIGICILFFPTLVLGTLNGILSPLVKATHSLMAGQTLDMEEWQERLTATAATPASSRSALAAATQLRWQFWSSSDLL